MAKPQYTKPTSQLDLEERQKEGYVPPSQLTQAEDLPLSENGYVGVDPIYQNYANETEKPHLAEKGPEKKLEELVYAEDVDTSQGATAQGEGDSEPVGEDEDKEKDAHGSSTTPAPSATPSGKTTPPSTSAPSNS